MSSKRQLLVLIGIAALGLVLLVITNWETLLDTWRALLNADLLLVLMLPLLQVINYFLIGLYYRVFFGSFGAGFSVRRAWGVVASMNFVNQVLPSGGLSGITYLAYGFRAELPVGKTSLIQLGRYMFSFLGYVALVPIVAVLVFLGGQQTAVEDVVVRAESSRTALLTALLFIIFAVIIAAILQHPRVTRRLGLVARRFVNGASGIFRRGKDELVSEEMIESITHEFHTGIDLIKSRPFTALKGYAAMQGSVFMELAIVYVALQAVGAEVSIWAVFISFVAANVVGVISVIPGDVGVHEATVILILSAFGVEEAVAISAVLLYRVFNKMIFLPIGFYFYSHYLKPAVEKGALKEGGTRDAAANA